jgi:hypothetical protein
MVVSAIVMGGILIGSGVLAESPVVDQMQTIEGHVTKVTPEEYYSYEVTFSVNGGLSIAQCVASMTFKEVHTEGVPEGAKVLAVVDMGSMTRARCFSSLFKG